MMRFLFIFYVVFGLKLFLFADYDLAKQEAISQNKFILVEVSSKFCPYCRKMELELFADNTKMEILKKNYVVLRYKKGDNIPEIFRVNAFPVYFFVNPKTSQIIDEFPGYMPSLDFLEFAQEVAKNR